MDRMDSLPHTAHASAENAAASPHTSTMKTPLYTRFAAAALALTMPFALVSCGDSHEKVTKDVISLMNKLGDTLGTVTDKASAEAAKDKLKALGDEMKALKSRMDKVGKPSGDAEKKLEEKYKSEMEAAMKKMMSATMKIATAGPEAQAALKDVMENFKDLK